MKNILLLGGSGYIGSYFLHKNKQKYKITNVDLNWFAKEQKNYDYKLLNKQYINSFDVVLLLAGHSSVKMCDADMMSSFNNNVKNFVELLEKLNNRQKFIYASSSSVYGNTNQKIVDENYTNFVPYNYYDLTKQIIDSYAQHSKLNYYGLRFGTVNGWSPNLRIDVMINSMVHSALTDKHIKLYIKNINRAILGIDDLNDCFNTIINCKQEYPGIYNLASFNATAEEIANKVSNTCEVPIVEYEVKDFSKITNVKVQTKSYDFSIDVSKFKETFNFNFRQSIEDITKSLLNNYNNCIKTSRNELIIYE